MTGLPFVVRPDGKQADDQSGELDLARKVAELMRDTGVTVTQAIQIVKELQPGPPKKPPKSTRTDSRAAPAAAHEHPAQSDIERAVQPYFEALALLCHALEAYKATPRKKAKVCNCFFDTRCSDGGSFENHAVVCMTKGHESEKLSSALERRRLALLEWIDKGEDCRMDMSPGQIIKVRAAVAHLAG